MDVAWNLSALSRYANTAEGREVGGNHSAARAKVANVPQCRQTFVLQHRIVKLIARNRRFTVDLSGARPRRLKSEFLSRACYESAFERKFEIVGEALGLLRKHAPETFGKFCHRWWQKDLRLLTLHDSCHDRGE